MRSLAINTIIAVIWLLLGEPTTSNFIVGFLIGFAFLFLFRPVLGSEDYIRRWVAVLQFICVFLREFTLANLNVARAVLFQSKESLHPNFITYDVSGLSAMEILLLSYCITLTPGTTAVDVEDDNRTLIIHALDAYDADQVRRHIDETLRTALLRCTR
jgi:multicomponent Na+:H+ antiporter subunit E